MFEFIDLIQQYTFAITILKINIDFYVTPVTCYLNYNNKLYYINRSRECSHDYALTRWQKTDRHSDHTTEHTDNQSYLVKHLTCSTRKTCTHALPLHKLQNSWYNCIQSIKKNDENNKR